MKKYISLFLILGIICAVLSGCENKKISIKYPEVNGPVEQVGKVPAEFEDIVKNNLFDGVTAYEEVLLKTKVISDNDSEGITHKVWMMDKYGNNIADYEVTAPDLYHITTLTATDDGGFLFVVGFRDRADGEGGMMSERGFASRVVKCDKNGNLQFDMALKDIEGYALQYCFGKGDRFYLFGTIDYVNTKDTYTDVYMLILDKDGKVLKENTIGGSDFDSLDEAEITEGGFILSIDAQSDDGDFKGSDSGGYIVEWTVTINDELEITDKKKEERRDYFDDRLGEKDGKAIYQDEVYFKNFDAGSPNAFIDYGDYYLIVSENQTGVYENIPLTVSAVWYYTETVYSAYSYDGKLIFRATIDSSPDFDSWVENIN